MPATITWLGHATFRLNLPDGRVVYIDPWLEGNPTCPEGEQSPTRCDMILLTHGHADHVGAVEMLVKKFYPPVVANYDLCIALKKVYGGDNYQGMNTGGTQTVDGVKVSLTQAYHSSAIESSDGLVYGGMPNGVVADVEGLATVYHAGDTDVFTDMKLIRQLFAPKICILPIGDHFTMGAKGAALAAEMLEPAAILPCHYKTFPLLAQSADTFRSQLPSELRPRLHTPEPGQSLNWTAEGIAS